MRIGVEQSLTNVVEALRAQGHEVVELKQESDANGCDCCVVTGMDTDVMGIQNVATQGPVIEASGLSADQICQEVQSRLQ
ncbi:MULTISPECIES: YkuS family protein [Bacillaceae]|uniref:YkuS family protein n=1 Tax=Bacillaceae TaxID=186817 RepID=UPI001A8E9C8D|nr:MULTISPECIES: YkuS family protein [Rossellomorea]MBN8192330.1 YkuS family protein [Bacillus sp. NTK074B]MBW3112914.1 YkuS family protein [Bacillus sp. MCCB 382]MCA1059876.1 YkuS family protein [Rossellomorea aquimaris]MDX8345113.1 YkuS family protein [Rossellomorea sp. YZS02]